MDLKSQFLESPNNVELLEKYEIEYSTAENWDELLNLYNIFIETASDEKLMSKYNLKKALIYDEMLSKPEAAILELKNLISYEEFNYQHFKYFESLCKSSSSIDILIEAYIIILAKVDYDLQLSFNYELASLYGQKNDYKSAVKYLNDALSIDGTNTDALNLLNFILNKKNQDVEILELLSPLYERIEDFTNLLQIYNLFINQENNLSKDYLIDILNKKINLLENYFSNEEEEIFSTLLKAFKLNQSDLSYFEKLEYYVQNLNIYSKFVNELISVYQNSDNKSFLAYKIGIISYISINNPKQALTYLQFYVNNVDVYHEDAFNYLIEILNNNENYNQLVLVYLKQSEFIDDVDSKIGVLKQASFIYEEKLFKLDEAIALYNKIIEISPADTTFYLELERLYESAQNWGSLLQIIERLREMVDDVESYDRKRALIYDKKLQDYKMAIKYYEEILESYGYSENLEIVERLRDLYKQENQYDELKNFLEKYKGFVFESEEIEKIDYEIAEILYSNFQNYSEAYAKLTNILDMNPEHEQSLKLLFRFIQEKQLVDEIYDYLDNLLESTNNIPYWIKLNQIKVKISQSKEEQSSVCLKIGDIYINQTAEPEKSYDYFLAAVQLFPTTSTYSRLKEYIDSMNFQEKVVEPLTKIVSSLTDNTELIMMINYDLGKILFDLSKFKEAEPYFKKVIEIEKTNVETLNSLDDIYTSLNNPKELFEVLLLKLDVNDEKIETLYRLRDISLENFNDKEKTITFLYQLFDIDEFNKDEHQTMLISFLKELKKWEELAIFYERVILTNPTVEFIEETADIYFKYLNNFERAFDLYEQILDSTENRLKILTNLETIYEKLENYERLVSILEEKFELLKSEGDKVGVIEIIFKLGKLYIERVAQFDRASKMFSMLLKAKYAADKLIKYLEQFIENSEILPYISDTLDALYNDKGEWNSLIKLYLKQLENSDSDTEISLNVKIAQIYSENLKNNNESLIYYDKVFILTQNNEYLVKIEEITDVLRDYDKLSGLYDKYIKEMDFVDIDLKNSIYLKLANIYSTKLDKKTLAVECLESAYNLDETNAEILNTLLSLVLELKNFERAKELYFKKLDVTDEYEITNLKLEISKFIVEKFRDFETAINLLGEILDTDPLEEKTIKFLLKLNDFIKIENFELKLRILTILKSVYTNASKYDELDNFYASLIHLEGIDDNQKIDLLKDEINIMFENSEYERGMKKYQEALVVSKGDTELLMKGIIYAEYTNDYEGLIKIYKSILSGLKENVDKVLEIYVLLGDISFKYLSNFEAAEKYFQSILEKVPNNIDALNRLESMYQEYGEYEKLKGVYERLTTVLDSKDRLLEVYVKLADLLTNNLGEIDLSIKYYEKSIEINPLNEEILEKLFNYYKSNESFNLILPIIDNFLKIHPEETFHLNRGAFFYLKNYKLSQNKEFLTKACKFAEKSYQIDNNSEKTELILLEIYKELHQYQDMAKIYIKKLNTTDDKDDKIEINIQLATLYAENLNNITEAEKYVEYIKEEDPFNKKILDVREKILYSQSNWVELIDLLDQKIEIATEEQMDSIVFKKVKILSENLNQYEDALALLKDLINKNAENGDYLFYSESIYKALNNLKSYFDFIKGRVPEIEDTILKSRILVKMGEIAYTVFKREEIAVKSYEKAIEYNSNSDEAIKGLKIIAKDKGDYNKYSMLLSTEFRKAKTKEEQNIIKKELIDIYINKLKQPEMVIPFKEEDYENDKSNNQLMLELIDLYSISSESFNFFSHYDDFLNILKTNKTIADNHIYIFKLGLACKKMGDSDKAIVCFETANRIKMGFVPGQMELGKLYMDLEQVDSALKVFQMLQLNVAKIEENEMKIDLFLNIGRLRAKTNDPMRAKTAYKKVLEFDANNEEALNYLK